MQLWIRKIDWMEVQSKRWIGNDWFKIETHCSFRHHICTLDSWTQKRTHCSHFYNTMHLFHVAFYSFLGAHTKVYCVIRNGPWIVKPMPRACDLTNIQWSLSMRGYFIQGMHSFSNWDNQNKLPTSYPIPIHCATQLRGNKDKARRLIMPSFLLNTND